MAWRLAAIHPRDDDPSEPTWAARVWPSEIGLQRVVGETREATLAKGRRDGQDVVSSARFSEKRACFSAFLT